MKRKVKIELPIRINFGGAWSDTPPFCINEGGCVCNTSALINNRKPIKVIIRKIKEDKIIIKNENLKTEIKTIKELENIKNEDENILEKITLNSAKVKKLGLKINIYNKIPKGSGLGTSSILILALLKAIYKIQNIKITNQELICQVLEIENKLGTGGGWQDQAGAIEEGIKIITSKPGKIQKVKIEKINVSKKTKNEIQKRFALIYTGKTRNSKEIVKEIMKKYKNDIVVKEKIKSLKNIAIEMKETLENGNINQFAQLLNKNYEISKTLHPKIENENTKKIFEKLESLIMGKMICGAGNGGFVEVILKENVKKKKLKKEIKKYFPNTLVKVWNIKI